MAVASAVLVTLAVTSARAEDRGSGAGRTSVLLITLDTTRADRLGAYGASDALTPYLDELVRSGTRFTRALSPSPLTVPSHASIMTGRVPRRHGVQDDSHFKLPEHVPVLAETLRLAGYRTAAFVSTERLDRRKGLDRGFDIYDDVVRVGERSAFDYRERLASRTTRAVLERLPALDPPFFLWVHYNDPHQPYVPPEPFKTRFSGRPYDGEVAYVDWELGGVLAGARQRAGRLITIVTADHGEGLGEHLETGHGMFLYQSTQHVPLILAGPGIPDRRVVRDYVGLVDIAPTILDLLGVPPLLEIDGRSLLPAIRGREVEHASYEMETLYPLLSYGWAPVRALVDPPFKYVEAPTPELYDLPADVSEALNLAGSRRVEAREMADALAALGRSGGTAVPMDPWYLEALSKGTTDPKDGVKWIGDLERGRLALERGNPSGGIAPLEAVLKRDPRNVAAMLALSRCYRRTGGARRAVDLCRRAAEILPDDDAVHFELAGALARLSAGVPSARDEARDAYEQTLKLNPRHADAYLEYASMLLRGGDGASAITVLRRAKAHDVRDPDLEVEIALISAAQGNLEGAKVAFHEALALHEDHPVALRGLGDIAMEEEDWSAAADYYDHALESRPRLEIAKILGAIRLGKLDQPVGAAEAFELALDLAPESDPDRETLEAILSILEDDDTDDEEEDGEEERVPDEEALAELLLVLMPPEEEEEEEAGEQALDASALPE